MTSNDYVTPDLASILRTLAASAHINHTPPTQVQSSHVGRITSQSVPSLDGPLELGIGVGSDSELEEGEYDPTEPLVLNPTSTSHTPDVIPAAEKARSYCPPVVQKVPVPHTPVAPSADHRMITNYPAALRHVTNIVSRNEASMARLRKLIASQHQHERQWWDARETLIKKQGEREAGRKKVDEVLRSVGGNVSTPIAPPTLAEDTAELARYDRKVHQACVEMVSATKAELQGIGIPFFGTKRELVIRDGDVEEQREVAGKQQQGVTRLLEKELLVLQKRILELLEDLC